MPAFSALWATFLASFRSRAALEFEILALRHQLGVLQRSVKRPKLSNTDRILGVWLSTVWSEWRTSVFIVKAATVIAWHRKGFRLFWTWKVRHGKAGRPMVAHEVRELIRIMSRENPIWGVPHIHGELLKLGIDIGETSVSKYMVRRRRPPSQTWKTFLANHVKSMVSGDFFTVPTIRFQVLMCFWCWHTTAGGFSILPSLRIRQRNGVSSNCGRPFPGTARRSICCEIVIGSSEKNSSIKSRPWGSSRSCPRRDRRGNVLMSNGSSEPFAASA